ncbi:hypothetical protein [Nubsella zeaxanthinifaciens]|uniref:hypothetical protein n=1 Tax=Nubsella zeaxanthinifaciens TaxID=392412 RepID=UPI000DE4F4A2|nr:hypothetical protein [Nubsella zeaxanthinifaciens]
MKQLDKTQIDYIKNYILKKGIRYVDVQMEILDHVASAVEEKMGLNESLTLDQALKEVHQSFGIFGFSSLEDAIVNGMNKKYNSIFWANFKSFFDFKYLTLLLLTGILFYKVINFVGNSDVVLAITLILILALTGFVIISNLLNRTYNKFLAFRVSASYFGFIGSFFLIFKMILKDMPNIEYLGININVFLITILMLALAIYVISGVKTARLGKRESRLLMEKYTILDQA